MVLATSKGVIASGTEKRLLAAAFLTCAMAGAAFAVGTYELVFCAGDYLRGTGQAAGEVLFLDEVPIRFGVTDAGAHYHVPLLLSPFAYSTYRGS